MSDQEAWGSDVPISAPEPLDPTDGVWLDMGGFGFHPEGLKLNINSAEIEDIFTPWYAPAPMEGDS